MASELAAAAKPLSIEAIPTVTIGGLPVAVIDRAASARIMVGHAVARRGSGKPPLYVTSANGQVLSMCAADPEMKKLFLAADGMPLVFASRWRCRRALPERVATTDLFHDAAKVAVEADAAFYMLGGTPEALRKAMSNVRRLYPRLRLVGSRHGYFRPEEEETVIADINASRPEIGMVPVACRAATVAEAATETNTSTGTAASSRANSGRRSNRPSA